MKDDKKLHEVEIDASGTIGGHSQRKVTVDIGTAKMSVGNK